VRIVAGQRQLTDRQIADFKRDGFLVVRGMFSAAEMKDLARWTDEVESYPETPGKHMMYFEKSLKNGSDRLLNRMENFYPYHDGFRALFDGAKLRGAVSELLGDLLETLVLEQARHEFPPHRNQLPEVRQHFHEPMDRQLFLRVPGSETRCDQPLAPDADEGRVGKVPANRRDDATPDQISGCFAGNQRDAGRFRLGHQPLTDDTPCRCTEKLGENPELRELRRLRRDAGLGLRQGHAAPV